MAKVFEHLAHVRADHFDFERGIKRSSDGEGDDTRRLDRFLARRPRLVAFLERHHKFLDPLGEVEFTFILWAAVFFVAMACLNGSHSVGEYANGLHVTEPLFVICVMIIAASKPIGWLAAAVINHIVKLLPGSNLLQTRLVVILTIGPLLGSLITEPAAMTITATLLADSFYSRIQGRSGYHWFRYGVLAVLLVNVSIGGTLTSFAAPPVLMVAGVWDWDTVFMLINFGWKAALAVLSNALLITAIFWGTLNRMARECPHESAEDFMAEVVPWGVLMLNVGFLAGVVVLNHYPVLFLMVTVLFLFFAIQVHTQHHPTELLVASMKNATKTGVFLLGIIIFGPFQTWWLQPSLLGLDEMAIFWGAVGLTAITDNAALTYLGSQVKGLTDAMKYRLVAGAVTGGGLTIIANAPNPAGIGILRRYFPDSAVGAGQLFVAAVPPTAVAAAAFLLF